MVLTPQLGDDSQDFAVAQERQNELFAAAFMKKLLEHWLTGKLGSVEGGQDIARLQASQVAGPALSDVEDDGISVSADFPLVDRVYRDGHLQDLAFAPDGEVQGVPGASLNDFLELLPGAELLPVNGEQLVIDQEAGLPGRRIFQDLANGQCGRRFDAYGL